MRCPKLVQSLDSVHTCTDILLIFVPGDEMIDYRDRHSDTKKQRKK